MFRYIPMLVLVMVLGACSTTSTTEADTNKVSPIAPVAAMSPSSSAQASPARPMTGVSTPASQPGKTADPLKDPANSLSRRSVYFDFDKSLVRNADRPLLEAHAKYLRDHSTAQLTIQGNTDERGSREYNLALGQLRAEATKRLMTLLGAAGRQVETVSFGEEKPRCTTSDESCWAQDRRADLVYPGD